MTKISDVPMQPVPWLWPGYIPSGAVTLLVGDPDKGKTLVALDLAARVSTGRAWPDGLPGSGPRDVVILSAEDSASYTIRPRLEAAGADGKRIHLLSSTDPNQGLLSLKTDVAAVEAMLATVADPALLIVDPLSAYLPGVDTFKDNEVRSTLGPFVAMAERRQLAAMTVIHLNKNTEQRALQRIIGSVAFGALARGSYAVMGDPEDNARRLFLPMKMNLGARMPGLAFKLDPTRIETPEGLTIETVRPAWATERVTVTVDEVLRREAKPGGTATEIILRALADGPVLASEIEAIATRNSISERTAERIKSRLGIRSTKRGDAWYWCPPTWTTDQITAWEAPS